MTSPIGQQIGRDVLAPAQRLATIASILAEGVRRQRDDARRRGDIAPVPERAGNGLELSGPARPDRPTAAVGG